MTITELITALETICAEHGNLIIAYLDDENNIVKADALDEIADIAEKYPFGIGPHNYLIFG